MITSYRFVHSLVHATIALLCYQLFTHLDVLDDVGRYLEAPGGYKNALLLGAVGALTTLFRWSDKISRALIEKVPVVSPLIRRALAGQRFCEGDWPLLVVDTATRKLIYLGFMTVTYRGDQLVLAGRDWTADGNFALDFSSVQARYVDNRVQYWYEQGHDRELRGFTEMFLFPAEARPDRHTGRFLDEQHPTVRFYGRRQHYKWWQPRLTSEKDRLAAARQLWQEFEPRMAEIIARPISASWEL